ncbi:hypothetical protein MYCTH_2295851 [Thermothelomyces thermophilus ATCC 42464]|uniref:Sm domain-containing protein n=1 Tax=Thermothelomyces thermophilus (strain ATCC 42464 / BCRC 31852 / DSM 1799) TaxID=573729 RepID=G2Q6T4_THET4|nr:uncharacterized protein MYCTH_2295851 [Thermothelomyces thermophilus ATCC 42464]AEO53912.1 hypothetical protein MYCTH_2295851 [Thermothelomyces thermophilus ATCC 42464]
MSTSDSPPSPSRFSEQQKEEAASFLRSLLNKNFRVTTTDSRMFWGTFKCTDPESNIILQHTYEYRYPSARQVSDAAAAAAASAAGSGDEGGGGQGKDKAKVKLDMTSRYLGLVVIPGKYITRIEAEEFVSQMPARKVKVLGIGEQQFGRGTSSSSPGEGEGEVQSGAAGVV